MKTNKTKILATIGPASNNLKTLIQLIKSGVDGVRINFSHGNFKFYTELIENIKEAAKSTNTYIPILADLQGPKIRLGEIEKIILKKNTFFYLNSEKKYFPEKFIFPVTYKNLYKDIKNNQTFFINDGLIKCRVISKKNNLIKCKVLIGGEISSHKGINLPETKISETSLTKKDRDDVKFILSLKNDIDFIALSFVRTKNDVLALKKLINNSIPIISKIEKPEALENIDEIIEVSHGIMVARGDLGIEIPINEIPYIQKQLIKKANYKGKLVITATQMLESMISNAIPTRAEVSDVANAVFDGTDVVMLSGETAVGINPVNTVKTMDNIIENAELHLTNFNADYDTLKKKINTTNAILNSACISAQEINARGIAVYTQTGKSTLLSSKLRQTKTKIFAITPDLNTAKKTNLYWGVFPVLCKKIENSDDLFENIKKLLLKNKLVNKNDYIIITAGVPLNKSGSTNMMQLKKIF